MVRLILLLSMIVAATSGTATADLVLDLATGSPTSVVSGSTVFIDLVLIDTDDSHFGPNAGGPGVGRGLSSGGGQILQSSGTGVATALGPPGPGLDFDGTNSTSGGLAGALSFVISSDPAGINNGVAHIATFGVTITGLVGDTVTVTSGALPIDGNVVDDGSLFGTSIDAAIANFGSVTFTVTAVPEPSTWAFCGLGAAGLVWYRRRQTARRSARAV